MKPSLSIVVLFFIASAAIAQEPSPSPSSSQPPQMYLPDGQLLSEPVRVFVAFANLDTDKKPRLREGRPTDTSKPKEWDPFIVAPNQVWTERVAFFWFAGICG